MRKEEVNPIDWMAAIEAYNLLIEDLGKCDNVEQLLDIRPHEYYIYDQSETSEGYEYFLNAGCGGGVISVGILKANSGCIAVSPYVEIWNSNNQDWYYGMHKMID